MRRRFAIGFAVLAAGAIAAGAWYAPHARLVAQSQEAPALPAGPLLAAAAPVPAARTPAALTFRRVAVETSGDAPVFCLRFDAALDGTGATRYADWLSVTPPAPLAVTVRQQSLCLGGLGYGGNYSITLHRGMPAANGLRLAADQVVPAALGDRPALVDISGDGYILPRAVAHGLTVSTVNVHRLRIHVLRVGDRLVPPQTRNNSGGLNLGETGIWSYALRELLSNSATIVWSGTMAVPEDHNRTVQTAFPLASVIKPGTGGAFLVVAEDDARAMPEAQWQNLSNNDYREFENKASHWVIATDIALTAYTGTDGLHVAARSLASALPLAGVHLSLLSIGQDVLGQADTDAAGFVHFPAGLLRGANAAAPDAVVARGAGGDWTLMALNRPAFDFSDRGVTGRPSPAPLQAFVYTDRGIYRRGHTVEATALLRDRLGNALQAPLTLVLRRPNGMEARRWTLPPQPAGGFHQSIPLSPTAPHGVWTIEALADAAGAPVGRVTFECQDYVPQRLKVKLQPVAGPLPPGQTVHVALQGDFLYGAPAAGLHGQADLRVTRDSKPVAGLQGWQFGPVDETVDDKTKTIDLPLSDAAGRTAADAAPDVPEAVQAPLKLQVTAGLFDNSGRQVSDTAEVRLATQKLLIGLRSRMPEAGFQAPVQLDIAAYAPDGTRVARPHLSYRVIREERLFDWFEEGRAWRWHYRTSDNRIADGSIDVPADKPAVLTRKDEWGHYRLEVRDEVTGAMSSIRYDIGWTETAGDVEQPDKLTVSTEKPTLAQGQTTRLHIAGPFAGHAAVLIANDRVLETREIEVPQGGIDIPVAANADWGAGAYALVTLYRPLSQGGPHAPVRAVGTVWIGTDTSSRALPVSIGAPDKVRPQNDIAVPVHIGNVAPGAQAYVTLAAVDEGVLQLTHFQTPDPVGFLFGKRALGVAMRDDYAKLLDGSADPGQIQGGDEGLGGPGLPVESNRTVALFAGPIPVDASGDARVVLHVPDFEGQLRLMAVAYTDQAAGRAERTMIVRDPVIADVALPRFLADGDRARLAVSLDNTDGAAGAYHVHLGVSGAAQLAGGGDVNDTLAAHGRARHAVEVSALGAGIAAVELDLTGPGNLHVHRSWQIPVRSAHAPVTLQQSAWQPPGAAFHADAGILAPFVPGSAAVSIAYSRYGGFDVPGLLMQLDQYPFGCTEQLTSTAYPLVYYGDPSLHAALKDTAKIHQRVQDAIDTILDRQDVDGQFGLWRAGDGEASIWLNVYALDFLLHARDAGYDVPNAALDSAAVWLRQAAQTGTAGRSFEDGVYVQSGAVTQPYAAYVLARLGYTDLAGLRRLHDTLTGSKAAQGGTFWLASTGIAEPLALGQMAGAFALAGDHARAGDALRMAIDNLGYGTWPSWWFGWSYFSRTRDWAGLVAIAAETGDDAALRRLFDISQPQLLDLVQLNTQEQAFLLNAAHALAKSAASVPLIVNGVPQPPGDQPVLTPDTATLAAGLVVVNAGDRALWRALTVAGSPREAGPALSAGYTIRKRYFSLDGKPQDPARLRQNDRVVVVLDGALSEGGSAHRTVLTDLLPAGWEIEGQVRDEKQFGFIGPLSATRVQEARDDRYVAAFDFGDSLRRGFRFEETDDTDDSKPHLGDDAFRVAYVARAITPGTFTLPEAVVQDMYRPQIMARTAAGVTEVAPR